MEGRWDVKWSIKCLWMKIRRVATKGDLMYGICYWHPNQDDKANETLLWLLKQVLGQQNLVLKGDFNYPDTCENNTAVVHKDTVGRASSSYGLWYSLFLFQGGDEGESWLSNWSLAWCLHSPVTAPSPKCLSDCQSGFSLSRTSGMLYLNSPWPLAPFASLATETFALICCVP